MTVPLTPYSITTPIHFPNPQLRDKILHTQEGIELGRMLFYDPILSADSTMSCATCHQQKHAFASDKKFDEGVGHTTLTRNTPALYNLAWHPSYFWDGRAKTLMLQALEPVRRIDEMASTWNEVALRLNRSKRYPPLFKQVFGTDKVDSMHVVNAVAQFELSIISNRSKYDQVLARNAKFTKDEYEGFVIANDQSMGDCLHCHTTDADAVGSTYKFSNNGLDINPQDSGRGRISKNEAQNGHFKIPSLRNVAITAPYMHDGRFNTLEEVVEFYSTGVQKSSTIDAKMQFAHRGGVHLDTLQKKQLVAFLKTLTDSALINDPKFSNPFD